MEVTVTHSAHLTMDDAHDVKQVVSVVTKAEVFDVKKGRRHSHFKQMIFLYFSQSLAQVKYGGDSIMGTEETAAND
jgi:hypothetical protein